MGLQNWDNSLSRDNLYKNEVFVPQFLLRNKKGRW